MKHNAIKHGGLFATGPSRYPIFNVVAITVDGRTVSSQVRGRADEAAKAILNWKLQGEKPGNRYEPPIVHAYIHDTDSNDTRFYDLSVARHMRDLMTMASRSIDYRVFSKAFSGGAPKTLQQVWHRITKESRKLRALEIGATVVVHNEDGTLQPGMWRVVKPAVKLPKHNYSVEHTDGRKRGVATLVRDPLFDGGKLVFKSFKFGRGEQAPPR